MFGYVVVDKAELKIREFEEYRGFYCGLCKTLAKEQGFFARLSVSYDLTFLSILYSGLYEPQLENHCEHCIAHPCSKRCAISHPYQSYCSDMTVFLTWLKCMDDWHDEHKLFKRLYAALIGKKAKKIQEKYKEKCNKIIALMQELSEKEKAEEKNPDTVSGLFGQMLAEIFVMENDRWENLLRSMGFYLGKFIYLLDAFEDFEKDMKKKNYNPLTGLAKREDFNKYIKEILTFVIAECCRSYRQLPIIEHTPILENILYSGVWTGYDRTLERQNSKGKKCTNSNK